MSNTLTKAQTEFIDQFVSRSAQAATATPDAVTDEEGAAPSSFADVWDDAHSAWDAAEEIVAGQITTMQAAFRKSGSAELEGIANIGLPSLTGNTRTKVLASIMDVSRVKTSPDTKVLGRADKNLATMQAHLKGDPRIAACDNNPFGLKVSIAQTLGGAIQTLRQSLKTGMTT